MTHGAVFSLLCIWTPGNPDRTMRVLKSRRALERQARSSIPRMVHSVRVENSQRQQVLSRLSGSNEIADYLVIVGKYLREIFNIKVTAD